MSTSNRSVAIGIDLGTTHCCVAYIDNNETVEIIANSDGHRTTPSYVMFTESQTLIGRIAKDDFFIDPRNVAYDSKRLIGRKFNDKYIQEDRKNWTFKVKDSNNLPIIEICLDGKPVSYKPHEISAMLLEYMKTVAEDYIGKPVTDAVITVPAHFNYHQRSATAEAGKLAGLNVLGMINEPTAAALAYIHKNKIKDSKNIMVYDLGGGTLDVSVVKAEFNTIVVTATGGNTHLGGRDFDNKLKDLICKKIINKYGDNGLNSDITKRRIRQMTENVKIRLSSVKKTVVDLQCLINDEDVQVEISREEFEQINYDLFILTLDIVEYCLGDAKLERTEIDDVVLVGGSTRIPKIQNMLSDFFDGKHLSKTINPDEAVAYGAAVQTVKYNSSNKTGVPTKIIEITPLSLGVDIQGGLMDIVIPRNSVIPITVTNTYISVCDKQTTLHWGIYEGERRFFKDNTKLGDCTLKIPPKPPGHPVDLIFHINEDGILKISASDQSGLHANLSIVYEQHDSKTVNDIINDAKINKSIDNEKEMVAYEWGKLRNYCTRLKAVCDYDKKGMDTEEKDRIKAIADEIFNWTNNFSILDSNSDDVIVLQKKYDNLKNICEPITKRYDYKICKMNWEEFYQLMTN